jgi:hypothetical protein
MARRRSEHSSESSGSLTDFLQRLGDDPEFLEHYKRDKHSAMREHGLSDEHRQIVANGDVRAARDAVAAENPGGAFRPLMFVNS